MKLKDTLIFSFAVLFLLIGIHQAMIVGMAASYWLFMIASGLLLWYQIRKKNQKKEEDKAEKELKALTAKEKKRKYKL